MQIASIAFQADLLLFQLQEGDRFLDSVGSSISRWRIAKTVPLIIGKPNGSAMNRANDRKQKTLLFKLNKRVFYLGWFKI